MTRAEVEFDRQVANLLRLGYPGLAGLTEAQFTALVEPLRAGASQGGGWQEPEPSRVPFLLVISTSLVPAGQTLPLTTLAGRSTAGFADFAADDLARFAPAEQVTVPERTAYLAFALERGEEFCSVTPDAAVPAITDRGRSPLTIAEGVALITQHPAVLEKNKCFSLAGSRCGDRRVPALWISQRAPKLGWCWAGNPHTWLGTASCAGRWPA